MQHQSLNISPDKQKKLRSLLDSDGLDILIEVITSQAFVHECQAANDLRQDCAGYETSAKNAMKKALETHACVAILESLRDADKNTPFTVATAKPNTITPK